MVCGYALLFLLNIKIKKVKTHVLCWTNRRPPAWEIAAHLAVAVDVFDGVLFCAVLFSHEMSWMRSGTELSQFLRLFLPTQCSMPSNVSAFRVLHSLYNSFLLYTYKHSHSLCTGVTVQYFLHIARSQVHITRS